MVKINRENEEVKMNTSFRADIVTLLTIENFEEQFNEQLILVMRRVEEFLLNGSDWSILKVLSIHLNTCSYKPTGSSFIETPPYVANKKAIVNIQNTDNKCFIWSVLAGIHKQSVKPHLVKQYKEYESELVTTKLKFPLSISQVKQFEQLNNKISINVFALDGKTCIYPVYATPVKNRPNHVNLLLLTKGDKAHYTLISDLNRLLRQPGDKHKKWYCNYCLHGFSSKATLDSHQDDCIIFGPQKIILPDEKDRWVQFKNIENMEKVPYVIYADFESFTRKLQETEARSTHAYELHEPSGFAYYVVCRDPARQHEHKPEVYRGENVIEEFLTRLRKESDKICKIVKKVKAMKPLTAEQEKAHAEATKCAVCDFYLSADKVFDHDHMTGIYRQALHQECNIQLRPKFADRKKTKTIIPVIFHNLRGYDVHLILKRFKRRFFDCGDIKCVPNNMEKYISFTIDNLKFIDSFQFLSAGLDKLAAILKSDEFEHTRLHIPVDKVHLMIRKGTFCYDYWDGPEKALESRLPPRDAFFSQLKQEAVNEKDYQHAQNVWTAFELESLGQYHDLYLKTDTLILADVFGRFRTSSIKLYRLDPCHYLSTPGLSWDAMLLMTRVKLELLTDREMVDMVEKSVRGGICNISHKQATANNVYMRDSYDPSKPSSYILYLDM